MQGFSKWLDSVLDDISSSDIVAFNFNLYDDGNGQWSAELIGSDCFDPEDSDWACDEVFSTRESPFQWKSDASWEQVLDDAVATIKQYLQDGKYASLLKSYKGIGAGFVDGDLIILWQNDTD